MSANRAVLGAGSLSEMRLKNTVRPARAESLPLIREEDSGFMRIRYPALYTVLNTRIKGFGAGSLRQSWRGNTGNRSETGGSKRLFQYLSMLQENGRGGSTSPEVIARELAELTGIPCRTDVLFRIRKTVPQKRLDPAGRAANLQGAFGVSKRWAACENVLLIDDIYTTGATVEKAAKMLKKAGCRNVYFLTISIGQGI